LAQRRPGENGGKRGQLKSEDAKYCPDKRRGLDGYTAPGKTKVKVKAHGKGIGSDQKRIGHTRRVSLIHEAISVF
jgi:hypothetical protein